MKKFLFFNTAFCLGLAVLSIVLEGCKDVSNTQAMGWRYIASVWIFSDLTDKYFELRK